MAAVQNLAKTGYIVSDLTLTEIARKYVEGIDLAEGVRTNYLRILVAHSKRELNKWKVKRATVDKVLEAVEAAHDHLYAVVLEAVTTPDILPTEGLDSEERNRRALERNRRSTFARTAKATLVAWVNAGGRLSQQDPGTVTKEGLRRLYAPTGEGRGLPLPERIQKAEVRLEALVKELAEEDPDEAREFIEELQTRLAALLEPVAPPGRVKALTTRRRKVGDLTLHPHH